MRRTADRIIVSAARFSAHIGVTEEERAQPQDLVFDIEMVFDTRPAGRSDDFSQTVCYTTVVEAVEQILTRPFHLIEAVAEAVAARVLADHPVEEVFVRVTKPGAFPGKRIGHASVEITRTRDG